MKRLTWNLTVFALSFSALSAENDMMKTEYVLCDFEKQDDAKQWRSIDDVVMGGISDSRFETNESIARFHGHVSLENNGGFASVRSLPRNWNLDGSPGLRLRVKGDGKQYKFCIKTDSNFDGVLYQARFQPAKDEWDTIELRFDDFVPTFRGRLVESAPPLNGADVRTLGFMISDKQSGMFELKIDWIHKMPKDSESA